MPEGTALTRLLLLASRGAVRFPRGALAAALALAIAGALGLVRLELRTDGRALAPPDDPTVRFDAALRRDFGLRDPLVVYLETSHPNGIYNTDTLARLGDLSAALAELPAAGPAHVMSLATEARPRVHPGTLRFRPLLDPWPDTPERMDDLREDVDDIDILTGTLVSADRRAAAVLVGVPTPDTADPRVVDRADLYRRVVRIAKDFEGDRDEIMVVGAPAAEALLGEHVLADLLLLIPLAMGIIAAVLLLTTRRPWGVWIAFGEVGACLLFTFGVMGWSGTPVYLTTAVLPVILATAGIADEVHILWRFQRELAGDDGDGRAAVLRTMAEMVRPVTITSATTATAFLSFLLAPIEPVASFGLFAAVGIAFCWLWSLVAVPACLVLAGPARLRRGRAGPRFPGRAAAWIHARTVAHPRETLVVLGGLSGILGAGVFGLYVQDSWIDGFAPESAFRRATERVDRNLSGTHALLVHVGFEDGGEVWPAVDDRAGPLLAPRVLNALGRFEQDLRDEPGVGGVLGAHSHLSTVNYLFMAGREGSRRIPDSPGRVALAIGRLGAVRGEQRRREVIHDDAHRTVVTLLLRNANYRDTARIVERVRESAQEHLAPLGARVRLGGDVALSQAMIPAIVRTQLGSLFLALVGAWVIVMVFVGSARLAGLAILPTAVAVLWLLGAMGWLGIPLGVATSTFCAISLGIGVDYAVHYLERVRRGSADPQGLTRAARQAAPAILADAVAVAAGFGVLAFSRVPANARLGIIIAVTLLASAILTLLGLSALLAWRPVQAGRESPGTSEPPPAQAAGAGPAYRRPHPSD